MLKEFVLSFFAVLPPSTGLPMTEKVNAFNQMKEAQQRACMEAACKRGDIKELSFCFDYCKEDVVGKKEAQNLYAAANGCNDEWKKYLMKEVLEGQIKRDIREELSISYDPNVGPPLLNDSWNA